MEPKQIEYEVNESRYSPAQTSGRPESGVAAFVNKILGNKLSLKQINFLLVVISLIFLVISGYLVFSLNNDNQDSDYIYNPALDTI